jgi:gluconolactonase
MLRALAALLLLSVAPPTIPASLTEIFSAPAEMRLRGVADDADGLAVDDNRGTVVFSDLSDGRNFSLDPSGALRVWRSDTPDERTTGRARGASGARWLANRSRNELVRWNVDVLHAFGGISGGPAHIAVLLEPRSAQPRDVTAERVFWTDPARHPGDTKASAHEGGIYEFVVPLGRPADEPYPPPQRISAALQGATGLSFSPDERLLYVSDAVTGRVHAFVLADRAMAPTLVAELSDRTGAAVRALATDAKGRIYCATPKGVAVLAPDGRWLGLLDLPEAATDLAWGGADRRTLWITTKTGLARVPTSTAGAFPR